MIPSRKSNFHNVDRPGTRRRAHRANESTIPSKIIATTPAPSASTHPPTKSDQLTINELQLHPLPRQIRKNTPSLLRAPIFFGNKPIMQRDRPLTTMYRNQRDDHPSVSSPECDSANHQKARRPRHTYSKSVRGWVGRWESGVRTDTGSQINPISNTLTVDFDTVFRDVRDDYEGECAVFR